MELLQQRLVAQATDKCVLFLVYIYTKARLRVLEVSAIMQPHLAQPRNEGSDSSRPSDWFESGHYYPKTISLNFRGIQIIQIKVSVNNSNFNERALTQARNWRD